MTPGTQQRPSILLRKLEFSVCALQKKVYLSCYLSEPVTVPKPIALEPCFGNKAAVLSVFVRLPRGLGGIPPPGQSGLAVASALVDISQQMPIVYKEKTGAVRNRKQQPPAQPGTCI
ncbi:UNVERIFIED_CONTAM: hypothetical protein K2H54_008397 [Gekko kuhli]